MNNLDARELNEAPPSDVPAPRVEPRCTDAGNAARFVADHGLDVRYMPAMGKWGIYQPSTGTWMTDEVGAIHERARQSIRALYHRAIEETDPDIRKALLIHAQRSESERALRSMVNLAQSWPGVPVLPPALDVDPWLLNAANGVVDLRTGEAREHRREDLFTKCSPVPYWEDAQAPRFERFLSEVFVGRADLVRFVQRAVGYSLTGETREHCLFILWGIGANGKSAFLRAIQYVLGAYAQNAQVSALLVQGDDSRPRNDIARLAGARFVTASEIGDGKRLDEAGVKELTGADTVRGRWPRRGSSPSSGTSALVAS